MIDIAMWGNHCLMGGVMITTFSWDYYDYNHGMVDVKYFQSGFYMKHRFRDEIIGEIQRQLDFHHADPKDTSLRFCGAEAQEYKSMFSVYFTNVPDHDNQLLHDYNRVMFDTYLRIIGGTPGSTTAFWIEWISENYTKRVKYVKTGWPLWRKKINPRILLKVEDKTDSKKNTRW